MHTSALWASSSGGRWTQGMGSTPWIRMKFLLWQLCGAHLCTLGVSLRGSEGRGSTPQTRMEFLLWQLCGAHFCTLGVSPRASEGKGPTPETRMKFLLWQLCGAHLGLLGVSGVIRHYSGMRTHFYVFQCRIHVLRRTLYIFQSNCKIEQLN